MKDKINRLLQSPVKEDILIAIQLDYNTLGAFEFSQKYKSLLLQCSINYPGLYFIAYNKRYRWCYREIIESQAKVPYYAVKEIIDYDEENRETTQIP